MNDPLERFYEECREADVPAFSIDAGASPGLRLAPVGGFLAGCTVALLIVLGAPAPDAKGGREAAEAMTRMQMAKWSPPEEPEATRAMGTRRGSHEA